LLSAFVYADQDNILELVDKSPEGREILDAIYLELNTQGANLDRGKLFQVLKVCKQNAAKSQLRQKQRLARRGRQCRADLKTLRRHIHSNRRSQYTISRHLNSNAHATRKNQQYIDRALSEFHGYDELRNLIIANRGKFINFHRRTLGNLHRIVTNLRRGKRILVNAQRAASGQVFIELKGEDVTALSEIRVDFASNNDELDGLRPIITSLLQTMSEVPQISKADVRRRVIRILRNIIKVLHRVRERIETESESAHAIFEALIKNFEENKTRCQKLQQRLVNERKVLVRRQVALNDSRRRARRITKLSKNTFRIRHRQCVGGKRRNVRLHVRLQKMKNIVAQVEEILQERFGRLKSYFIQRAPQMEEPTPTKTK